MLDINKYAALKQSGKAVMSKIGPATAMLTTPKFDPDTGAALDSEINTFNLTNIEADIQTMEAQLAALKVLRDDVTQVLGA